MRFDLAIFDFDGTLADSGAWFFGALNEAAARFGFRQIASEEREALRHCDSREILRRLRVPVWRLPAIARHMRRRAAEGIGAIRMFDGVAEALEALHARGTGLAVVTSNSEPNVRQVLGDRLAGRIGFYGCGASLFGKAPRLRQAVRHFSLPAARAVYVGDEIRDIEAARAAGTASAAVTWGYAAPEALIRLGPTVVVERADALALL